MDDITDASLGELIQLRDELMAKINKAEGANEADKEKLKKGLQVDSIKAAKKKLEKQQEEIAEKRAETDKRKKLWWKQWGDKI